MSKERIYLEEGQEFVIEGQIFHYYFSDPIQRTGIVIGIKGMVEPPTFTATKHKPKRPKK